MNILKHFKTFSLLIFTAILLYACKNKISADRAYYNAKIWTVDSANPTATVIAVKGNKIVYIGYDIEAIDATTKIDLQGKLLLPGFIDNHTHFLFGGFSLKNIQLKNINTKQDFINAVKTYCQNLPDDSWVLGGNWNNEQWGGELPNKSWIDSVSGNHPISLSRYDGHLILANSKAIEIAKINKKTNSPKGGIIGKDAQGNLTGIFKDEASNLIGNFVPLPTEKQLDEYLNLASQHAIENGVTQVHDMSSYNGWKEMETYQRAYKNLKLKLRVYALVPLKDWEKLHQFIQKNGRGDDFLKWGGLKGFVDGSLGSTTAWLYQPYIDAPNSIGLNITDTHDLKKWVTSADSVGLQVVVHAIGDRANGFILNAFQSAISKNGVKERSFRVEHAQHLNDSLVNQFARLQVVPSMQPYSIYDDGSFAHKRLDHKRLQGTYVFKTLLEKGVPVCFGSDWTVTPLNPLMGIYSAVTRQTSDGKYQNGWYPEQKISVEQAIQCYTKNNATSVLQGKVLGTLQVGKLADFVVLDENILEISPEKIKDVKINRTIIDGKEVYIKN